MSNNVGNLYFVNKMNYSFMYRYFVGEIYKEVYSDWENYQKNPNKILKLLTGYGYPEE